MKIDTYDYVPNKDSNNEGFIIRQKRMQRGSSQNFRNRLNEKK